MAGVKVTTQENLAEYKFRRRLWFQRLVALWPTMPHLAKLEHTAVYALQVLLGAPPLLNVPA